MYQEEKVCQQKERQQGLQTNGIHMMRSIFPHKLADNDDNK